MSVTFKDNSRAALSQMDRNKAKAVTAIGLAAVEVTNDYMTHKYSRRIWQTGDLMRSITSQVRPNYEAVDIGTNLEYGQWVHNGTNRMPPRPFLKDALLENTRTWKEIASEHLGEGFKGLKVNVSGTQGRS